MADKYYSPMDQPMERKLKSDTDTARATILRHRSLDIIETPPAKKHETTDAQCPQ